MKNEKLTLEIQRAQGELSTEEARLLSMQRSRSSYSRSGESARFSEAATEQRIKDLKIQLQLLNLENERMNLCSGFDGVVVRSDLREELLLRPVRLGQKWAGLGFCRPPVLDGFVPAPIWAPSSVAHCARTADMHGTAVDARGVSGH